MGLFSFLKDAGKSIFGGSAEAAEPEKLKEEIAGAGVDASKFDVAIEGDKVVLSGAAATQEEREKAILAVGNIEGVATVEDVVTVAAPEPESAFYEVKKGDTLSGIAKSQYGDGNKYMKIFEANKPMLSHPDKIYPGQKLRIPA
ncbi:peptidoglycan-binding protein LysM [Rubrimonas cliftonensis]|uniref:Potassium binding protein Kbp n=1 Tax=Rubrimonas cliftonensis TaxID=89524 RepID=A0A1H3WQZ7_9RHOB|nr:peptidoglycan-binding protein LysM [Rubrimonas cliftonensis]SDZ88812.1 BON domain-containing protein [Rubrimonas cliftonensis]